MKCAECGGILTECSDPITEDYKGEAITVTGVDYLKCSKCGEVIMSAKTVEQWSKLADIEYRNKLGLLTPEQIRSIRIDLGLTQDQFQDMLGVGAPTVSRWETGRNVQTKTADKLMRIASKHACVVEDLAFLAEVRMNQGCLCSYSATWREPERKPMEVANA